jgi:SH3 domain protein
MRGPGLMLLCMLLAAAGWAAEQAFVSDRLLLGLHAERQRESAILKLLPSATAVEVLERQGAFARVRDPEGAEGWVDASYLTEDRPARLSLADLQAAQKELAAELDAARRELAGRTDGGPPRAEGGSESGQELQRLQAENLRLRRDLEQAAGRLAGAAVAQSAPAPAAALSMALPAGWVALALGGLFVVGLGSGMYLMDYLQRRRHGGFRV